MCTCIVQHGHLVHHSALMDGESSFVQFCNVFDLDFVLELYAEL